MQTFINAHISCGKRKLKHVCMMCARTNEVHSRLTNPKHLNGSVFIPIPDKKGSIRRRPASHCKMKGRNCTSKIKLLLLIKRASCLIANPIERT